MVKGINCFKKHTVYRSIIPMCSIVLFLSFYFRNINRNRLFVETTSIPHNHNVTTEQGNKRQNIYKYLDRPFRVSSLRVYGYTAWAAYELTLTRRIEMLAAVVEIFRICFMGYKNIKFMFIKYLNFVFGDKYLCFDFGLSKGCL